MSKKDSPVSPPWAAPKADDQVPPAPAVPTPIEAEAKAKLEVELKAQAEVQAKLEAEAAAKLEAVRNVPLATAANAAKSEGELDVSTVMVTVTVPRGYNLRLDDHVIVPYQPGVQEMPLEHADHWWSKQNGVVEYAPKKPK